MSNPIFPPEIEYTIATIAFSLKERDRRGKGAVNLILIAKRFHAWLIPHLMRTIALRSMPPLAKHPVGWTIELLSKYGVHTKNLFLHSITPELNGYPPSYYLSLCPNVNNLVLWTPLDSSSPDSVVIQHQVSRLPLTRLSMNLANIDTTTTRIGETDLSQVFSKITHLETFTSIQTPRDLVPLTPFRSLTHLLIPTTSSWGMIPTIFSTIPTLQVLGYLDCSDSTHVEDWFDPECEDEGSDPRVVLISAGYEDEVDVWLDDVLYVDMDMDVDVDEAGTGMGMGMGMWGKADEVVREQMKRREEVLRRRRG